MIRVATIVNMVTGAAISTLAPTAPRITQTNGSGSGAPVMAAFTMMTMATNIVITAHGRRKGEWIIIRGRTDMHTTKGSFRINRLINIDCRVALSRYPDNFFQLAIVDPPYFSGPERRGYYGRKISPIGVHRVYEKSENWQMPDREYFDELFRVSENQIIWGCNYFDYPFGPGRIVWDKCNGESSFSDCEIAYCSLHDSVRLFRYMWNGMFQGKSIEEGHIQQGNKALNEKRIHSTQKPVALYKWLLQKYAKPGGLILDTHVGSASSLVACYELGYDYVGVEIDEHYYRAAQDRLNEHMAQMRMEV